MTRGMSIPGNRCCHISNSTHDPLTGGCCQAREDQLFEQCKNLSQEVADAEAVRGELDKAMACIRDRESEVTLWKPRTVTNTLRPR